MSAAAAWLPSEVDADGRGSNTGGRACPLTTTFSWLCCSVTCAAEVASLIQPVNRARLTRRCARLAGDAIQGYDGRSVRLWLASCASAEVRQSGRPAHARRIECIDIQCPDEFGRCGHCTSCGQHMVHA